MSCSVWSPQARPRKPSSRNMRREGMEIAPSLFPPAWWKVVHPLHDHPAHCALLREGPSKVPLPWWQPTSLWQKGVRPAGGTLEEEVRESTAITTIERSHTEMMTATGECTAAVLLVFDPTKGMPAPILQGAVSLRKMSSMTYPPWGPRIHPRALPAVDLPAPLALWIADLYEESLHLGGHWICPAPCLRTHLARVPPSLPLAAVARPPVASQPCLGTPWPRMQTLQMLSRRCATPPLPRPPAC